MPKARAVALIDRTPVILTPAEGTPRVRSRHVLVNAADLERLEYTLCCCREGLQAVREVDPKLWPLSPVWQEALHLAEQLPAQTEPILLGLPLDA